ncbi:MAG: aminoglycoside phosphotransferase family protein, partial [Candidatus Poribacteria bacterium]
MPTPMHDTEYETLRERAALHRYAVYRRGQVVIRETGPWALTVHSLLRHLAEVGFAACPRVVGSGFDDQARETLTYIEGDFTQPGPWSVEGVGAVGELLRALHDATASYVPPEDAVWGPWFGRPLGGSERVIGHCDVAPWNIVVQNGMPVALIDWDFAGPVDPLVELAQACWLNAKLHDDQVAALEGLPSLAERAKHLRAIVDGYGLPAAGRRGFVDRIIEFVVHDTAWQAVDLYVTPETTDPTAVWALAWRAASSRGAPWASQVARVLAWRQPEPWMPGPGTRRCSSHRGSSSGSRTSSRKGSSLPWPALSTTAPRPCASSSRAAARRA